MAVAALNIQRSDIQIYASVTDCGCQIKYVWIYVDAPRCGCSTVCPYGGYRGVVTDGSGRSHPVDIHFPIRLSRCAPSWACHAVCNQCTSLLRAGGERGAIHADGSSLSSAPLRRTSILSDGRRCKGIFCACRSERVSVRLTYAIMKRDDRETRDMGEQGQRLSAGYVTWCGRTVSILRFIEEQ